MRKVLIVLLVVSCALALRGADTVTHPFVGITHIRRTETSPRNLNIHVIKIDLRAKGIRFKLTPPGGTRETVRQTTLQYLEQGRAQVAINAHYFSPFPSADLNASVIGIAASEGKVFSAFEKPAQNYALLEDAPGLNIDPSNKAKIVHRDPRDAGGLRVRERVKLWNTVAGSAQIVTNGVKTIPCYVEATRPSCTLVGPGPANYANGNSWYDRPNARTAIGLSTNNRTLFLFTVDAAGGSGGMPVGEVADMLIRDFGVYNALNLDGGGSTTLAMQDPATGVRAVINQPSDRNPGGRIVASSLAVFAVAKRDAPADGVKKDQPLGGVRFILLPVHSGVLVSPSDD